MLIVWFLSIKSLPNLLFGVLCLLGDQSHPFVQLTVNPLACCICWAGLLGREASLERRPEFWVLQYLVDLISTNSSNYNVIIYPFLQWGQ